jgi:hypothetical protein
MSTDLHTTEIEQRLRETFARHAAAAPLPTPVLPATPQVTVRRRDRRANRTLTRWIAVGAGAAATLAGVVLIAWRGDATTSIQTDDSAAPPVTAADVTSSLPPEPVMVPGPPEEMAAPFRPDGSEVPLAATDVPADFTPFGGADPASAVAVAVDGHPPLVRYRTLAFWGGRLEQFTCVSSDGGAGCQPDWMAGTPSLSRTSAIDNGVAAFDLFVWDNVPDEAAFVSWASPTGAVWQRPVAGIVAFPVTGLQGDPPLRAFDVEGNELDSVTRETAAERAGASPPSTTDNLTDVQRNEIIELANTTVQQCLTVEGNTWDLCFAETERVVRARFEAMGGQVMPMSDPAVTASADTTTP